MSRLDERWRELVGAAVLGTQRRPPPAPSDADPLPLPPEPAEPSLLARAAVLALARRAAWHPPPEDASSPTPAPQDKLHVCGARVGRLLALLLSTRRDLLAEALTLIAAAGRRVPPEQLPALLDAGAGSAELRPLIRACGGRRGGWLAAQHEPWAYAADFPDADATWRTGSRSERAALLTRLREQDPARARGLLAPSFASEPPGDRAAFLRLLGEGLSADDEPLLEAALDDRRREVRDVAASLLAQLPGSRLLRRTQARLDRQLRLHRNVLDVTLAAAYDDAMARDGVVRRPARGVGEHASWLLQQLGTVPPAHWSTRFRSEPRALLDAARAGVHGRLLLEGLTAAAVRHRDAAWLEALLAQPDPPVERLVPALPAGPRDAVVAGLLGDHTAALQARALVACPGPWDDTLGRAALVWLAAQADRQRAPDTLTRHAVLALGERLPPHLAGSVPPWPPAAAWRQLDDLTSATLRLRGALRAALVADEEED